MKIQRSLKYFSTNIKNDILLTGIQPTGSLHIGNYLGSIKTILNLQKKHKFQQSYVSIVDYHSLTTAFQYNHSKIQYNDHIGQDTKTMAKVLVASGLDVSRITLFVQSHVLEHSALCWLLSSICPQHWLNTMIQYKQKSHTQSSIGIYTYPILMAADILLYKATHVPVGQDQCQHLQLTKKIAQRFNKIISPNYFPKIKYVKASVPRVMSLNNPNKKMSKSDPIDRSRINLTDNHQVIKEKIRRAITDSLGQKVTYDTQQRPGLSNLLDLLAALQEKSIEQIISQCQQMTINQLKERLTQKLINFIGQITEKINSISDQKISKILQQGALKAKIQSAKNLQQIHKHLKLYQ